MRLMRKRDFARKGGGNACPKDRTNKVDNISLEDSMKENSPIPHTGNNLLSDADQRWSKRTLRTKIDGMIYERTTIAKPK